MAASRTSKYLPPRVADQVRGLGISSRRPMQGGIQGLHRSPDFGASVEFAEYRDYVEGDAPNLIDWQVFAKTDRYMIRRFQDETNLRACVLVDASASLHFKQSGPVTKFDYACSLAAGMMYLLVSQGDAAALSFFTDRVTRSFAPVAKRVVSGVREMTAFRRSPGPSGRASPTTIISAASPARCIARSDGPHGIRDLAFRIRIVGCHVGGLRVSDPVSQ